MKRVRIYLGDVTHSTIGLATEVFPLNVGYIAAYAERRFSAAVDIRLFKYIDKLDRAINEDPPDILALSSYPWNHRVDLELLRMLRQRRPEALRILGGPNFPHLEEEQVDFLNQRPEIDAHVYIDGEVGFANLAGEVLAAHDLGEARERLRSTPIEGCVQLGNDGRLLATPQTIRLSELDQIPSPYLTGLMDEFFDGHLSPMIQTNRGCPFRCTFCADGSDKVSKVNQFSVDRVRSELRYIGERVSRNVKALFISDLNFGMYKRDQDVCEAIAEIQKVYRYPHYINTATGKNSKRRVINAIERLNGSLLLLMSVQSTDPMVLENIKRDNIRLDDFFALQPPIRRAKLPTASEVIVGLPGETLASHIETVSQMLDAEIDFISLFTLMVLVGSEMATPNERMKWGFQTRFRVIPRDFSALSNGVRVVEVEEVVVSSKTLSFEEYVWARKLALVLQIATNFGFRPLVRFINSHRFKVIRLLINLLTSIDAAPTGGHGAAAPAGVVDLVRRFEEETRAELWDREEDIRAFYQDRQNFQDLIDGTRGSNLLQTYVARALAHSMPEWLNCVFYHASRLLNVEALPALARKQFEEIEGFVRARLHNLFGADRLATVPHVTLSYDIDGWIGDPEARSLEAHAWPTPRLVRFELSREQYDQVEANLQQFGHDDRGRARTLIRVSHSALWRNAFSIDPVNARGSKVTPGCDERFTASGAGQ